MWFKYFVEAKYKDQPFTIMDVVRDTGSTLDVIERAFMKNMNILCDEDGISLDMMDKLQEYGLENCYYATPFKLKNESVH